MAVGVLTAGNGDLGYNGRVTSYVLLSCTVAAMGGFLFGYDIGISGGVTSMEPFLKKFFSNIYQRQKQDASVSNYCKFDSHLLTAFTSSLYLAGLFASLIASSVTRSCGRRSSMLVGGVAFLAGAIAGGTAINVYMLIIGRLLLGVGVGFANQSVPLYMSEMAPSNLRGAITNGFQVCIGIGVLSANLINFATNKIKPGWGWRLSLSLAAVPALFLSLGVVFLPETPTFLLQHGTDPSKVRHLLQKLRGTPDVDGELSTLAASTSDTASPASPFVAFLRCRRYRPHFFMAVFLPFFQQFTGINIIAFYAPIIFRATGRGESDSLMSTVITSLVGLASTLISATIVDRWGRRLLFLSGGVTMLIPLIAVGGILEAELGDEGEIGAGGAYSVLVLLCVYVAGFGLSWGPLGWLVPSEIFPAEVRSAAQSVVVVVGFVFTFLIAQVFLAMMCAMKAGIFFFFAGWVLAMTAFIYLLLPETKGVPLERMEFVWRGHWYWKRFLAEVNAERVGEWVDGTNFLS